MGGAWYVGSAGRRGRWWGLIFLGVLAGLVGGAVLGALAGARRTASAYDRLLRASGAPHEVLFATGDVARIEAWLARNPLVDRYTPAAGMIGRRAPHQDWYSLDAPVDIRQFGRAVMERGRMPNPAAPDEVYITLRTAKNTGLDVGDEVAFRTYDASQTQALLTNPWTVPRGEVVKIHIVGVARDPSDAQLSQTIKLMFGTPAFASAHPDDTTFTLLAVWLKDGPRTEPNFERDLAQFSHALGDESIPFNVVGSRADAAAAHHAATAVVTGLVIFMLVAGLAGLVTLAQTVRRNLAQWDDENAVLTALGARRSERALAQVVSALPYLAIAPVVAVAVAYAASPLFPLGAVRALEPRPGWRADPVVLIAGAVAWLLVLTAMTAFLAWVGAARSARPARRRHSAAWGDVAAAPRALSAAIGARFGLRPGSGRRALRRTAFVGLIVAVAGVVASVVFVRSLDDFTHSPSRYGLAYDLTLEVPAERTEPVLAQLASDPDVAAVAQARVGDVDVEGRLTSAVGIAPVAGDISPTVHRGRLPANDREIAVGPKLLAELHKHPGDQLQLESRTGTRAMTIVGTTYSPESESSAFNGEVVLTPAAVDELTTNPTINALVRIRTGVDRDKVFADLDARYPYAVSDESLPHAPGPVRNLEQIARLPLALMVFFAFFGAAAVVQSMFLTARERRRDLAVLRGLGFRRRQVVVVLVGAACSVAAVALVVGVPLGILAGRVGWTAVARSLYVDPAVAIPVAALAAVALGLLAVSILAALPPASVVLRRTPGATLRAE